MIPVLLRDTLPRLLLVAFVAWILFLLEPSFHQHLEVPEEGFNPVELGPRGLSAPISYLAGLSMIILLAGFVSNDRREGYARMYFSHPTHPLAFYALRWLVALGVSMAVTVLFLVLGQLIAWGEFRGGWSGLLLAFVNAVIYGGLMALLSVVLPRGDAWVAFVLFLPTFFPQILTLLQAALGPAVRQILIFVLPPQPALQEIYVWLLEGHVVWSAVAYSLGYGLILLTIGGIVLSMREWG
jgi:ABC-type transport system involved in multi-copper enzyme maturation permease subunit